MGVLTTRLHGSITAIAAMATVSVSNELPDKSCLKSFSNATAQTLFLSSLYAPMAASSSGLVFSVSPSLNHLMAPPSSAAPAHSTTRVIHVPPSMQILPSNVGFLSSHIVSQSSSIRFYRAKSSAGRHEPCILQTGACHSFTCYIPELWRNHDLLCKQHPCFPSSFFFKPHVRSFEERRQLYHNKYYGFALLCKLRGHLPRTGDGGAGFPGVPPGFGFDGVASFLYGKYAFIPPTPTSSLLHTWHAPNVGAINPHVDQADKQSVNQKPTVVVVLLGWLGAEQRHLKKYADWYTARGIHAVTFVVPMKDLFTLNVGDKAEKHVDALTYQLIQWLKEETKKGNDQHVIFHTFSNTGWLTYGAVLERLIKQGDEFLHKIKGCVVDSAPSARHDPQVWASGFTAALLRKGRSATQNLVNGTDGGTNQAVTQIKPSFRETTLLAILEKFFSLFLQVPYVNRRLNDVVSVLSNQQPDCPQLYIYSSADTIIPAELVEEFIEKQRSSGRVVSACNFQRSPHVDHFRTYPEKYSEQLSSFLKLCVPAPSTE